MIKKFKQFINENDSSYIDWEAIEELCMNTKGLPDCIPQNIRQWDAFIKQYERAVDLVNGTWEPHYDWETKEEFEQSVNEQFFLGKGFKNSIYECFNDLSPEQKNLFKNVDWRIIETANRFTTWSIDLNYISLSFKKLTELPLLPIKVGGYFYCHSNQLTTLEGAPQTVGASFYCHSNKLTTLKGAPQTVGTVFSCHSNQLTTLEGAPQTVGGSFFCHSNKLPKNIPTQFPGEDLHKYIDL